MIRRPLLAPYAHYRFDPFRRQHLLVIPEAVLVLDDPAAAVIQACDGREMDALLVKLRETWNDMSPSDVQDFLTTLANRGLVRDAEA